MKKISSSLFWISLIILSFLFAQKMAMAQAPVPGRTFSVNGDPTGRYNNFGLSKDLACDTVRGRYKVQKTSGVWNEAPGYAGWETRIKTGPDKFGARHDSSTFLALGLNAAYITANYPGSGATTAWTVDRAALQCAINEATDTRKAVELYGTYFVNGSVTVEKYFTSLVINGNGAGIYATGTTSFAIFTRPLPTDNGDANVMGGNTKWTIRDLYLIGQPTSLQTGLNLGPSEKSSYENIFCQDLDSGIIMRFQLSTWIVGFEANNSGTPYGRMGLLLGYGIWSGATCSNSQSNSSIVYSSRFVMVNNTATAIKVQSGSGVEIRAVVIEGTTCDVGVDFMSESCSVVHDFKMGTLHFECTGGAVTAAIRLRSNGLIFSLDGAYGQYPAYLVSAEELAGGSVSVDVLHVYSWVPKTGIKYFNNVGGSNQWFLTWNEHLGYTSLATIPTIFNGTGGNAVSLATLGTMGNGNPSKVIAIPLPR